MAKDVKFWKEDGSFKLRVCGVIVFDNKILISNDNKSSIWQYPGGHVQLGEDTKTAVVREVLEESNIETEIIKKLATIQLFLKREDGKPFHEIGYYYLLKSKKPLQTQPFQVEEIDNGEKKVHNFKWITFEELKELEVYSSALKETILNNLENQELIYRLD